MCIPRLLNSSTPPRGDMTSIKTTSDDENARDLSKLSPEALARHETTNPERMPLHARTREFLRDLALNSFEDGDKFYPEPVIIEKLKVSQGTVRRALTDLAAEGLLVRKVPLGTFVHKKSSEAPEIRVIMPGCNSVFLMGILEKLLNDCGSRKLSIRIHHTMTGTHGTEILKQFQGEPSRLRVLLLGVNKSTARSLYLQLSRRGIRVVNVDTLAEQCGDAYVGVDNTAGIQQGMEHLVSLGHHRILLLVNEPITEGNIQVRVGEFKTIMQSKHLRGSQVEICPRGMWRDAYAKARLNEILLASNPPTAIFTVSDTGAWVSLKCLSEMNISVPEKISVLGFDDDRASAYMQPALSTLAQPIDEIARRAIDLLVQSETPTGEFLLPPKLVIRESTGKATGA